MILDITTLAFITSLIFTTQTIAVYVQYRVNNSYPGPGWWLAGAVFQALGFLLMLTLHFPSVYYLAIFANPLVFAGQLFLYIGMLMFLGKKPNRLLVGLLFTGYILIYYFFIFVHFNTFSRSLVVFLFSALISWLTSYAIYLENKKNFSASANFTAWVFLLYGFLEVAVTVITLILPPLSSYAQIGQESFRAIAFIIPILGSMLWTFGFILMINQRLNAEKDLLLKEVHHRMKNNMNTIRSILSLQAGMQTEKAAVTALEDAENRVQSMAILYDKLYTSTEYHNVSVAEYLPELIDEIISNFPTGDQVTVERQIDDCILSVKALQPLGIIINELLTNTMKYAFAHRSGSRIGITLTLDGNRVRLIVEDNGKGMPDTVDFAHPTGFGLVLVHELTRQLKGTIRIERGMGTRIVLEFTK